MTPFCFWMLPCILLLKRFPRLVFYSFCPRTGISLFIEPVTAISLLLFCLEYIVSALFCDTGVGPCKHASFASWHTASFASRGHWRDIAGNRLQELVCVLSCSPYEGSSCQWHACRTRSGAHCPASFAGTQAGSFLFSNHGPRFPTCQPQSIGTLVGSDLFANFNPPAMDQLPPRITQQTSLPSSGLQLHPL